MRAGRIRLALFGLSALALAACSSQVPAGSATTAAELQPLGTAPETTSLSQPATAVSAADGPIEFALHDGSFAAKGLTVSVPLSAEAQVKEAVVTGGAPLDNLAGSDALDLYAQGYPIQAIGCTSANVGFYVFARKGVTARRLAGTTVGVPSLDGAPQFAMDDFAARHGVNPARVTFTPLGSIPNVLAALEAGRIDVGLLSTPFNLRAKADGLASLGFAIGPPSPYVVNTGWAAKNGATITSWIEAFVQGTWAYYTDKKAAEAVLASFLGLNPAGPKDAATLSASFKNYLPPVSEPLGECSAANFAPYLRFFPAQEQARLRNLGRFIDNRYVTQLARSGFYARQQARYGPVPGLTLQQVIASQPPLAGPGRQAARS